MAAVTIAGLGSHHGDDRIGWLVVDALEAQGVGAWARLLKLDSPHQLLSYFDSTERLIVVDAIRTGNLPGTIHCLSEHDLPGVHTLSSSHGIDLATLLQTTRQLGWAAPAAKIVAIELDSLNGGAVAAALREAIPHAVEAIQSLLAGIEVLSGTMTPHNDDLAL